MNNDDEPQTTTGAANICAAQCSQDSLEVFQVRDKNILRATWKVQGHSRKFCVEWYSSYPWLVMCITTLKTYCVYCRYCHKRGLLTDKLGEAAFVTSGYSNWKKALQRIVVLVHTGKLY